MTPTRSLSALATLLALAACGTRVPTRHVAASGRDAGDCLAAPCKTIGYAVAQAHPGDAIDVDSGVYHETVLVTKRLALTGHHATIDADGDSARPNAIKISGDSAAGTSVAGFTIRHARMEGILVLKTSRITIENDSLLDNDAFGKGDPHCSGNLSDCGEAIHLQSVTASVVRANVVRHNLGGILLTDENGPTANDTINDNMVIDNPLDCGITLASHWVDTARVATPEVAGVYHNVVVRNTANGSGGAGIGVFAAGPGGAAWGNVVEENTAMHNGFAGLMIHSHAPKQNVDSNVFRNNTLASNGTDIENPVGLKPAGISVYSAVVPIRGLVITGNRISDQHYGMILVHADSVANLASNPVDSSVAQATLVQ